MVIDASKNRDWIFMFLTHILSVKQPVKLLRRPRYCSHKFPGQLKKKKNKYRVIDKYQVKWERNDQQVLHNYSPTKWDHVAEIHSKHSPNLNQACACVSPPSYFQDIGIQRPPT